MERAQLGKVQRLRAELEAWRPAELSACMHGRDGAFHTHVPGALEKKEEKKRGTPVFYAILVAAHLYFSRCASERERSERERCASSRVPFAMSRLFAISFSCFGSTS